MIVIHNFNEAVHFHGQGQGRLPFRLLQDQAMILFNINPEPNCYVTEAFDITPADIERLLHNEEALDDYNGMLGGEAYVCETEEDLKQILGMDMAFARTHGNRWPNVTELVMGWDQCQYLKEKDSEPEWAMFLLCWNNAGGPVFYVPKNLWRAARVAEHIAETDRSWG